MLYPQFKSAYCVELVGEKTETADYRTTCHKLESEHEPFNLLYQTDSERELQSELRSRGLENQPEPICCSQCQGDLETHGGMVGERVLVCPEHGIVWEDQEDAIRRVI